MVERLEHLGYTCGLAPDVGDLDLRRNLKLRTFVSFVLGPVFREMQPRLRYAEMGRRGVTAMQYYAEFENKPELFGYGNEFSGDYAIRLCRSISDEPRGSEAEIRRVERLILETRAMLTGRRAAGAPPSLGFEPPLGEPAVAGRGRVLHVLTRPREPPGKRWVIDIPPELEFLQPHALQGPFPAIPLLTTLDDGFAATTSSVRTGVWGLANSDVYQHVHAREYIYAMENGITDALASVGIALESYAALHARMIFRRPSFVGQRYVFGVRLYRRGDAIIGLGAFRASGEDPLTGYRQASVVLRFEGRLV